MTRQEIETAEAAIEFDEAKLRRFLFEIEMKAKDAGKLKTDIERRRREVHAAKRGGR